MDMEYDAAALKVEAGRLTMTPDGNSLSRLIEVAHKELAALNEEVGALEEGLSPVLRPEAPRDADGATEADKVGEQRASPLSSEMGLLIDRLSRTRNRIRDLFARAEL